MSFLTREDQLEGLLPAGFRLCGEPVVTVTVSFMTEIEWLAGRGYNTLGVGFPAEYAGERDLARGSFLAVLWENLADPILTGREQLGFSKIYCAIPPPVVLDGQTRCTADWLGFKFMDMCLTDMVSVPAPLTEGKATEDRTTADRTTEDRTTEDRTTADRTTADRTTAERTTAERATADRTMVDRLTADAAPDDVSEHGADDTAGAVLTGTLHYKYMPRTGEWGEADAEYAVLTPSDTPNRRVVAQRAGLGSVRFHRAEWRDMPTQFHIVNALAELEQIAIRGAHIVETVGGKDLSDQRILK